MKRLGDSIQLISGQHIEAAHCNSSGHGFPYLTGPSDFIGKRIKVTKYTEFPQATCLPGDILVTVKGSGTGSIAIADKAYCISRQLMAVRCVYIDPLFVEHLLEHYALSLNNVATGLIPGITRHDVLSINVPELGLREQKVTADLLSTWDAAIEKTERLIAAKEKRFGWLADQVLFGRFVKGKRKSTRWYSVPVGWNLAKIGDFATEISVVNREGHDLPVLSCTKHAGLVDSLLFFGKQVFSQDTSTYKVVSEKQFVYATNHIEEGSIGYQNLYPLALVSPMYTVFKANKSIDDRYLFRVLKTSVYRHIFEVNTSASVDRRGSLRWTEFSTLPFPLPPKEEQQQIAHLLETASMEIATLEKPLEQIRKQKHELMQKLLSAEWKILRPQELA